MAIIKRVVHAGDIPTTEAVEEVRKAQGMPIIYDEDSPDLFYSVENQKRLMESVDQARQGKMVTKSLDELGAMVDE